MEQSIPVIWSEVMQEWVLIDVMPGSFSPLRPSAVFTLPIESSSSSSLITSAQPQLLTNTSVSNFEVLTGQSSTVDSSVYQELTSAEFVASDNQAFVVQGSVDQEGANGANGDGNSGEELQYLVLGRMQHVNVQPDQALNLSSSDVGVDPNCWGDSCPCKAYESQVLYSVKCNGCFRSIGPSELVMRVAGGAIYHTDCFTCGRCGRHLTKGDEFALRRGGLLCRRDLDACLLDVSLSGGNSVGGNGVSIAGAVEPNSPDGCAAGENSGNGNGRGPISPNGGGADLGAMMGDTGTTVEHCGQLEAAGNYSPRTSCEIVLGVANIKSEIANTNSSSSPYSPSNSNTGGQQSSQQSQSVQPPPNVKPDGRRGPKRPRTILTTAQRRAFKASFEISQKPCRKVRETLAKETGLSVRIVQVWFQNQRAKLKKIQRKQQQAALVHGGGGGNGGGNGGNGSHGGGGGNGNGFLNGSESGTGMGSAHSSDKSKDDSTDDEDDDCSSQANTAFGSVSGGGGTGGNMQSMTGYGMLQSPDGSYYSTGREDDSTGGGGGGGGGGNGGNYMMTSGAKSDLGALDDSETSLCELDDGNGILVRPNSTGVPSLHVSGSFGPSATSMMSPLELTCLTGGGGQSMFSPNITGNMIMPFGGGGLPLPPQQLGPNHLLTTSSSVSESSLTPIDKLYSMQNSYFSSSSTGGNPQEQECL